MFEEWLEDQEWVQDLREQYKQSLYEEGWRAGEEAAQSDMQDEIFMEGYMDGYTMERGG